MCKFRLLSVLLSLLLPALGCSSAPDEKAPVNPGNFATASSGWLRGDLHFHTNHSEDAKKQGGDDLAEALEIADAYRAPEYLARFPERTGDGLDFVAVTDHRTDAHLKDPAFRHDHLIVVPGEEYGGEGHANIIGLRSHIDHKPAEGQTQNERHAAAQAEAHAQGAIFSVNHACQANRWPWTVDAVDAVEVWNAPWTSFWGESTLEDLDQQLADNDLVENPYIRAAIAHQGGGSNEQALWFWYGMLTRGLHPAAIGGSDRHMLVAAALPTTYVRPPDEGEFKGKRGKAVGWEGVVAGIRAKATFVSSSPHGPQIALEAEDEAGVRHPMGARLPAGTYTVHYRVGRAKDGLLRLVSGRVTPGEGPVTPAPEVVHEEAIQAVDVSGSWRWEVPAGGAWLHAVVLEPRVMEPLHPDLESVKETLSHLPQGKAIGEMLDVMGVVADLDTAFDPLSCDPAAWEDHLAQCMPTDKVVLGTFYMSLPVLRLMNGYFEGGEPTRWAMGALTSAFLAGVP